MIPLLLYFVIILLTVFHLSVRGETDWIQFRYNLQNAGQTPFAAAPTNHILWSQVIGTVAHSSPSVVDGVLYIGSDQGLFSIKIEDGSILWSRPIIVGFSSPLIIPQPQRDAPLIVVGGLDGNLYAYNKSGSQLWQTVVSSFGGVSASPTFYVFDQISDDVTLYLVGNRISKENHEQTETGLWAIDGRAGTSRWFFKVCTDGPVHGPGYSSDDASSSSIKIDPTCAVGTTHDSINPTTSRLNASPAPLYHSPNPFFPTPVLLTLL